MAKKLKIDNGSDGKLLDTINKCGNALLIGILFLICSLPVITFGTSLSAAYYAMIKAVRRERSYPAKEFFRGFKLNLGKGILFTVLILLTTALFLFNRQYCASSENARYAVIMVSIYDVLLVFLMLFTVWIFPVISRFKLDFKKTVRITFSIAVRYFYFSFALLLIVTVTVFLIWNMSVGFTLVLPAVVLYGSTYIIEPTFKKFSPKPEDNEDGWYYEG